MHGMARSLLIPRVMCGLAGQSIREGAQAVRVSRAAALAALVAGLSACATVPPGHLGVVLRSNGVSPQPLDEGVHVVSPWSQVTLYDLRVDEHTETLAAISADGAEVEARASVLTFHAAPGEVVALAREVGPRFYDVLVLPVVSSTVRRVLAGLRADQLDTPGINRVQTEVTRLASERLRPYHIIVDSVNLRTLGLPFTSLAYAAVVDTGVEEQKVFLERQRVTLAKQRADATREKARGIAAAHAVVAPTLKPQILQDSANRAWTALLASPSTAVEVRASSDPTLTEVEP
jgi:regulator of protease activity HflC (stomatin/prohibitin superfamily)